MDFADNQLDLPGIGDIPAALARIARRAPGLGRCSVDHVALCIEAGNLPRYVEQARQRLPDTLWSEYCVGDPDSGMRIAEVRSSATGAHLVLAAPTGSHGQLVEFLAETGSEGLQHIAFAVADVRAAVLELAAKGLRFVGGSRNPEGAIVEVREGDNWLRQAFSEPLFGSLFIEVIERKGIVAMRPGNIEALYALREDGEHQAA